MAPTLLVLVASGATVVSGAVATWKLGERYGRQKEKGRKINNLMLEGHRIMHKDLERMGNEMNGSQVSSTANCPTCQKASEKGLAEQYE